jgi:hypothetical protein
MLSYHELEAHVRHVTSERHAEARRERVIAEFEREQSRSGFDPGARLARVAHSPLRLWSALPRRLFALTRSKNTA